MVMWLFMSEKPPTYSEILARFNFIRKKKQEYFICLSLDSGQRPIVRRTVTIGLLDTGLVHPREVFAGPIKDRAASVVVCHNHPSGDPTPSRHDIEATQQLIAAAQLLGLHLRDHIIVSKTGDYSFAAHGLIEDFFIAQNQPQRIKDGSSG